MSCIRAVMLFALSSDDDDDESVAVVAVVSDGAVTRRYRVVVSFPFISLACS